MTRKATLTIAGCWLLLEAAGAAPAAAACGDRPGTPNQLSAEVTSATSIRFKFRITTRDNEISRYYDAYVTEMPRNVTVKSYTGARAHGPYFLGYGGIDHFNFSDLKPGGKYCFRIRARTEAGTKGCVSAIWAGPVCATIEGGPSARPPATTAAGPWGALAADGKGHWGYGIGFASEAAARAAAVKGCGDQGCKVAVAGQVRCYAYFESRQGGYWYGLALHSSLQTAVSVARGGCTKGAPAGSCKQVKAQCG